jgi:F-type H+-transporting ATPase subunit a
LATESPLHQFQLTELIPIRIGGINASFTNSSLWMVVALAGVTLFLTLGMRKHALVPGRWQSMAEMSYEFIANLVRDNAGSEGKRFFPFIFTLFMFILFCNVLGMIPYTFTVTSHIVVTLAMALTVFIGVTIIGFVKNGWGIGPLAFIVVFIGFEIFVAVLQAYIFAVLSCLYLNDALHPHH